MASQDWVTKDFYGALGVNKNATDDDVKKAYRKLARQLHPDSNPGNKKAEERFKEVSEAYSVLKDKKQRKEYDAIRAFGGTGARFSAGSTQGGGGFSDIFSGMFGGGNNTRASYQYSNNNSGINLEDILGGFSSGGFGGGFRQQANQAEQRSPELASVIKLSFDQSYNGATVNIKGTKIKIPAGVSNGQVLNSKLTNGQKVKITIKVASKEPFTMGKNGNIEIVVPVTYTELTLGAKIQVPTYNSTPVTLKIPELTPNERKFRIKGKGVLSLNGDLIATVKITIPNKLTSKEKKLLNDLQSQTTINPRDNWF